MCIRATERRSNALMADLPTGDVGACPGRCGAETRGVPQSVATSLGGLAALFVFEGAQRSVLAVVVMIPRRSIYAGR